MTSKDIIKKMEAVGWVEVRQSGSHKHFQHPDKEGTVTVPHPNANMAIGTVKSIEKATGVTLRSKPAKPKPKPEGEKDVEVGP